MRIDRMLAIMVILLNRRKVTAKELAQRFEVSLRTVYRDIDALNMAGIPVISNQGAGGGYSIPDNYKLSKQFLSRSDLKVILSGLKGINIAIQDQEIDMVLEKVESLLPHDEGLVGKGGSEIIVFDTVEWGNTGKTANYIQQIYEAVKKRLTIKFTYVDRNSEDSKRSVEPANIVQKGFSWYLYGFCLLRKAPRLFKLARIYDLNVTDRQFKDRGATYTPQATRWIDGKDQIEVVLKFNNQVRYMVMEYYPAFDLIEQDKEFFIVKMNVPKGPWLIPSLLSYGDYVEVISPQTLRNEMISQISALSEKYL